MNDSVQFVEVLFYLEFHDKKVTRIKPNIFWNLKV